MNLVSMAIEYIREFFPGLTPAQLEQFETMMRLYPEWNEGINVRCSITCIRLLS